MISYYFEEIVLKYIVAIMVTLLLVGCGANKKPEPQKTTSSPKIEVKEKIIIEEKIVYKDRVVKADCKSSDMQSIGAVELVQIVDVGVTKEARIDTGATTTSIDAQDIVLFERDGKKWVKFKFAGKKLEKKLIGIVTIKRHGSEGIKRPSIMLRLALGKTTRNVKVTLADRSKFTYPILIGRNFLKDMFMVDVSKKMGPAPIVKGKK